MFLSVVPKKSLWLYPFLVYLHRHHANITRLTILGGHEFKELIFIQTGWYHMVTLLRYTVHVAALLSGRLSLCICKIVFFFFHGMHLILFFVFLFVFSCLRSICVS